MCSTVRASFYGEQARPWLLCIVRRVFFDWLAAQNNRARHEVPLDIELHEQIADESVWAESPEHWAERLSDARALNDAFEVLPAHFREVLVLRELADLSYKEIALIIDAPACGHSRAWSVATRGSRTRAWVTRPVIRRSGRRVDHVGRVNLAGSATSGRRPHCHTIGFGAPALDALDA